jgi:hypothetical protein
LPGCARPPRWRSDFVRAAHNKIYYKPATRKKEAVNRIAGLGQKIRD